MSRSLVFFLSVVLLCISNVSICQAIEKNHEKEQRVDEFTCSTFLPPRRSTGIHELNIVMALWMDGYATASLDLPIPDFFQEKTRDDFAAVETVQEECKGHPDKLLFSVWKNEIRKIQRSTPKSPLLCADILEEDERGEWSSGGEPRMESKVIRVWVSGYLSWKAGDHELSQPQQKKNEEALHRICLRSPGKRLPDAVREAVESK